MPYVLKDDVPGGSGEQPDVQEFEQCVDRDKNTDRKNAPELALPTLRDAPHDIFDHPQKKRKANDDGNGKDKRVKGAKRSKVAAPKHSVYRKGDADAQKRQKYDGAFFEEAQNPQGVFGFAPAPGLNINHKQPGNERNQKQ